MKAVLYLPDGNRRFATQNNMSLNEAYYLGGKTLKLFSEFFVLERRSERLIYHGSSSYTHKRADSSLDAIYEAAAKTFEDLVEDGFFKRHGISFRVINHSENLPTRLDNASKELIESTKDGKSGEAIVLIAYSLEYDINQALLQHPVDYNSFREKLILPDIDLVIRTTEMRPSGGPVYAMSQAQMMILNKLNPEVKREDLEKLWKKYSGLREHRIKSNPHHR